MNERVRKAIDESGHAVGGARDAIGDAATDARTAVSDAASDAAAAVGEVAAKVKPRLRGVSHFWAFFAALAAGAVLVALAPDGRATLAAAIYAGSLAALFGISALYHCVNWRPAARRWMRRLDHSAIFLLIAGTVTPFALLVMEGPFATGLLIAVWTGAAAGIAVELFWIDAPKWATVIVYLAVGWIGALGFPAIVIEAGVGAGILIAVGGVLYTAGAVVYARQRPDPNPAVFGYHEIFHVLVIAAAVAHFAAVALYALPAAS
jgi:hemolysin III